MSRPTSSACPGPDRASFYDEITGKIITELEAGRVPWVQPWDSAVCKTPLGMPRNAATGRRYSGINVLILWRAVIVQGFAVQAWLTFRQALALGGHVRKGERGTTVVYADRFVPHDERCRARDTGEDPHAIPFLKRFTVFNAAQCDGLPDDDADLAQPPPGPLEPRIETMVRGSGVRFRTDGTIAFYAPDTDCVVVPPPEAFYEPVNWHRTALHELGHASGARHRLDRDLTGRMGSPRYAFEELVAELNAAFCCATLGITPTVRHADYIGAWLDVLRADNRAIVRAASQASKAADYLLAFTSAETAPEPVSSDAPDDASAWAEPAFPVAAAPQDRASREEEGGRVLVTG